MSLISPAPDTNLKIGKKSEKDVPKKTNVFWHELKIFWQKLQAFLRRLNTVQGLTPLTKKCYSFMELSRIYIGLNSSIYDFFQALKYKLVVEIMNV